MVYSVALSHSSEWGSIQGNHSKGRLVMGINRDAQKQAATIRLGSKTEDGVFLHWDGVIGDYFGCIVLSGISSSVGRGRTVDADSNRGEI